MLATPTFSERRRLALPVLFAATFMAILDVFVVNVATPAIQQDLGASAQTVQWIVAGYVLAYAVSLVSGGRIGDAIGRRRAFRAGVALFTVASGACGLAPTAATLVAARVVQGLGAALMQPQVLSILQVEFPPAERPRNFALMGSVIGAASIAGQLVGGALIAIAGWRAVFLVNLPVGLAAVALARPLVPESRAPDARRIDVPGVLLGTLVLLLVITPAVEGRSAGWPWWVPAALAAAVPLGLLWLAHERRLTAAGGAPLVDLSLFALPTFRRGIGVVLAFWTAVPVFFLALAQYLQNGHGLSAIDSGLVFTPLAVAFVASSMAAPRVSERLGGPDHVLAAGSLVTVAGALLVAAVVALDGAALPTVPLIAVLTLQGAGQGLVMPAVMGTVLRTVPAASAGSASGVLTTAQQTGNALGVAVGGALFFAVAGAGDAASFGSALAVAAAWTAAGAAIGGALIGAALRADRRAAGLALEVPNMPR